MTVYIPEYVVGRWWEHLLHNQSALRLKGRLLFTPGVMVTSVPFQLQLVGARQSSGPSGTSSSPAASGGGPAYAARSRDLSAATRPRPDDPGRQTVEVEVGPVAHGGHCVARHEGRVSSSGTPCRASGCGCSSPRARATRASCAADAVEVLDAVAGPGRRRPARMPGRAGAVAATSSTSRCRAARAQGGGRRASSCTGWPGIDATVIVEAVRRRRRRAGLADPRALVGHAGRAAGAAAHRSHDVVPVDRCLIAHPDLPDRRGRARERASSRPTSVLLEHRRARRRHRPAGRAPTVTERSRPGGRWQVGAGDFWQVHPGAAEALVDRGARRRSSREPGEPLLGPVRRRRALQRRCSLSGVGAAGAVLAVESHRRAVDRPAPEPGRPAAGAGRSSSRVDRFVRSRQAQGRLEVVVLDPPRAGAGKDVVRRIAARAPRVVAYVACDPAALARDLAHVRRRGLPARLAARLRPLPDDPPRRVRRALEKWPLTCGNTTLCERFSH